MEGTGLKIQDCYAWEMETVDGEVFNQYDSEGNEQSWETIPVEKVVRISLLPKVPIFPRHDILIDITRGERFVSRKGRGIMKFVDNGYKLSEYLQCITTTNYRIWVMSTSGRCIVTHKDYELYF